MNDIHKRSIKIHFTIKIQIFDFTKQVQFVKIKEELPAN